MKNVLKVLAGLFIIYIFIVVIRVNNVRQQSNEFVYSINGARTRIVESKKAIWVIDNCGNDERISLIMDDTESEGTYVLKNNKYEFSSGTKFYGMGKILLDKETYQKRIKEYNKEIRYAYRELGKINLVPGFIIYWTSPVRELDIKENAKY